LPRSRAFAPSYIQEKAPAIRSLDASQTTAFIDQIRTSHREDFASFVADLEARIIRAVDKIVFMPLYGSSIELASIKEAITQVQGYHAAPLPTTFLRYDFVVRYTNGDTISGSYQSAQTAIDFLTKLM
jgi:hypothetical protein